MKAYKLMIPVTGFLCVEIDANNATEALDIYIDKEPQLVRGENVTNINTYLDKIIIEEKSIKNEN